jgi:hypothetical protein
MYAADIKQGEGYTKLRPTISIWLLGSGLFRDLEMVHLPFRVYNKEADVNLSLHCEIHLIQLKRWPENAKITNEKERWISFFKLGKTLSPGILPEWMQTSEMRQAMSVLQAFTKKEINYMNYLSRRDLMMAELTQKNEMKRHLESMAQLQKEVAQQQKDVAQQQKDLAQQQKELKRTQAQLQKELGARREGEAELARLRAQLKKLGVEPDSP